MSSFILFFFSPNFKDLLMISHQQNPKSLTSSSGDPATKYPEYLFNSLTILNTEQFTGDFSCFGGGFMCDNV